MEEVEGGISCRSSHCDFVCEEGMGDVVWPALDLSLACFYDGFTDGEMASFNHSIGLRIVSGYFDVRDMVAVHEDGVRASDFWAIV